MSSPLNLASPTMASFQWPGFSQLALASVVLYALYCLHWQCTIGASRRRMIKKHGCEPIRPFPEFETLSNSIVGWETLRGNLKAYGEHKLLERLAQRYERLGPTVQYKSGLGYILGTIEPENLKTVLSTNFKDWNLAVQRKTAFYPLLGHGIFTSDGAAWQRSRDLLRPNFVRSQVSDLKALEVHINQLIQLIPRDRSTVDLQDLFFRFTIDTATELLFGESLNSLDSGSSKEFNIEFASAFNRSQEEVAQSARTQGITEWFPRPQFKKDTKYVHEFVRRYVDRFLESRETQDFKKTEENRYIFLHELAKATQDPVQIRSELLNILLAGRDTTASLLSNAWFMLAKRPDVWTKLRVEVDELGEKLPTYEQVRDMKYLKAVLNECMMICRLMSVRS